MFAADFPHRTLGSSWRIVKEQGDHPEAVPRSKFVQATLNVSRQATVSRSLPACLFVKERERDQERHKKRATILEGICVAR